MPIEVPVSMSTAMENLDIVYSLKNNSSKWSLILSRRLIARSDWNPFSTPFGTERCFLDVTMVI